MYVLLLFKILCFCFGNLYFKFGSEAGASAFLGIYILELDNSVGQLILDQRPAKMGIRKFVCTVLVRYKKVEYLFLGTKFELLLLVHHPFKPFILQILLDNKVK